MSNDKTPAQAAEEEYPPRPFAQVPAHDLNRARRDAFIKGAEWQASQQRVTSVDQIIDEVMSIAAQHYKGYVFQGQSVGNPTRMMRNDLRSRLTTLLDQTPSPR